MSLATMAYVYVACTVCVTNFSTGGKFWLVKILQSYMFLLKPPVLMCFLEGPITSLVPRMGPGNEANQSLMYIQAMEQHIFKIFLLQHAGLILQWSVWVYSSDSCSREVNELSSWIRHCTALPAPCCSRKHLSVSEKELHLELPNLRRHQQSRVLRYLESSPLKDTPKLVLVLSASSQRENQMVRK